MLLVHEHREEDEFLRKYLLILAMLLYLKDFDFLQVHFVT